MQREVRIIVIPSLLSPNQKKLLLASVLILSLICGGCSQNNTSAEPSNVACTEENLVTNVSAKASRHLPISLMVDEGSLSHVFSSDELGGNFTEGLQYNQVTNVTIKIDKNELKLEYALKHGVITAEEIFCYARLDARSGVCEEIYESIHGLSHFTYKYPEYTLHLIYDIYETPSGEQHLISDMGLYKPGTTPDPYTFFWGKNGSILRYDLEDWGLSFKITDISPTSITLTVSQTEGQQIGNIRLFAYHLWKDEYTSVERVDKSRESEYVDYEITMDGVTNIVVDWTDSFGKLPSGDYIIVLSFSDVYDETDIHPLMQNYYDEMDYSIPFSIP